MKYIGFLCMAVLTCWFSESAAQDSYHLMKGSNGQTYLLAQAATGGTIFTDVYFRMGTVYEADSMSGACIVLDRAIDIGINKAIAGRNIRYYSEVTPTQFAFHFESANLEDVLPLIHDQIINVTMSPQTIQAAKEQVRADVDRLREDERAVAQLEIRKRLWFDDLRKLDVYGDRTRYQYIRPSDINEFQAKYFLPGNNTIAVTGTFSEQVASDRLQAAFSDFRRKYFNPELITHVIDFKPAIYNVQLLVSVPDSHKVSVSYQQPGARDDRAGSYCAYMLTSLLNDPQSKPARLLAESGLLANVKAAYECNNFQGTFTFTADVPSEKYGAAFTWVDSVMAMLCHKDYLTQADLDAEDKRVSDEFNNLRQHTHTFITQVARYRFSGDEFYFSSLADSIMAVDVPMMRRYMTDYFLEHPGVKCVYADTASLSRVPIADRYFAVNDSAKNITFLYRQNVTDIDSNSHADLQRLIQWLQINPDVHVQINGYADKGEYDKANDTSVINFIWNTPTFRKAMPQNGKLRYLRTEMMRAMKIAKAIYEAGITEGRITGTSMSFSSEDEKEAAANRKCTVTLEKIRPHISLYEYHFGHKRNEGPAAGAK